MPRVAKDKQQEDMLEGPSVKPLNEEFSVSKVRKPAGLDVNKLVKSVQGRYGQKEQGLAEDLTVGAKIRLSDKDDDYVLSTALNEWWAPLTGIKGIPYGRIVQIAGKADSGKSTTAMMFMKAAQESGALVILWDSEKKFSISRYQNNIGGDPTTICVTRSKNIVEGAKQVVWYVKEAKEQNPDVRIFIVWDSVGATMNTAEDDDEDDDYSTQPGQTAKQVGWAIKKFNNIIERYRDIKTGKETIAVLCVNQVYQMIGSVGSKEKGGETLYYLSSLILQLSRKKDLNRVSNKQKMKYGIVSRAKVRKNHLFDGKECIAEMDLVVSADGIQLAKDVKGKSDITGWDDSDEESED
jgi:RecA/RadA recombinase